MKSAQLSFRHFLDASREGSATHDSLATLTTCGDDAGNSYFPTTLLAGYSLLPFDMHGDTVVARASVVTVAEQDIDRRSSRFTARQRVREDLLEWDVIPTDEPGKWVVCNGLRFGYLGADSLTTWRPDGASYQSARALAASIAHSSAQSADLVLNRNCSDTDETDSGRSNGYIALPSEATIGARVSPIILSEIALAARPGVT